MHWSQPGADLLELGVPFSDPMADGPVIQEASERAIERGVSLRTVLDTVSNSEAGPDHASGPDGLYEPDGALWICGIRQRCDQAGVDGVLLVIARRRKWAN